MCSVRHQVWRWPGITELVARRRVLRYRIAEQGSVSGHSFTNGEWARLTMYKRCMSFTTLTCQRFTCQRSSLLPVKTCFGTARIQRVFVCYMYVFLRLKACDPSGTWQHPQTGARWPRIQISFNLLDRDRPAHDHLAESFRFFDLPAELRNNVYGYLMKSCKRHRDHFVYYAPWARRYIVPSMRLVSHAFKAEYE